MKLIIAVIQPFMLNKLTAELEDIENFPGLTVTDARGFGRRVDRQGNRFTELQPYRPKTRVEIAVRDEMVETILEAIKKYARTGNHGDGKIFVIPVEDTIRIQTGESGETAI
jgi:nitrogen regulatory protein PII